MKRRNGRRHQRRALPIALTAVLLTLTWYVSFGPEAPTTAIQANRRLSQSVAPFVRESEPKLTHRYEGWSTAAHRAGHDSLSGVIRERGGPVLAGVSVCVSAPKACCELPECVVSDDRGRFALSHAARAAVTVVASALGFLPLSQKLGDAEHDEIALELVRGGEPLSGRVSDATGGPIVGAIVTALSLGAELANDVTDIDGPFPLYLGPGAHHLRVRADGYSEGARDVWVPSSEVDVVMAPASSLAGRVIVQGAGTPVSGSRSRPSTRTR